MSYWTSAEIAYMCEHAAEGADAIAEALGRSYSSVAHQAHRYGVSLKRRWTCPRCGRDTGRPLSTVTGWCYSCTMADRRRSLEDEARRAEEEAQRVRDEKRARQRLYSRKYRAKHAVKKR